MAELANSSLENASIQTPEQKMWRAVLSQGVYEACSEKAQALPLTFGEMRSALEWADLSNRDFITVCVFAGYDPAYIFRKAKNLVRRIENGA